MNIAVYGTHDDFLAVRESIEALPELQYRRMDYHHAESYDGLTELLPKERFDVIFAAMDGAEGMEGVMLAKRLCPETKIVWLSDDKGFGTQAYRLECFFFAKKPVSDSIMAQVFSNL